MQRRQVLPQHVLVVGLHPAAGRWRAEKSVDCDCAPSLLLESSAEAGGWRSVATSPRSGGAGTSATRVRLLHSPPCTTGHACKAHCKPASTATRCDRRPTATWKAFLFSAPGPEDCLFNNPPRQAGRQGCQAVHRAQRVIGEPVAVGQHAIQPHEAQGDSRWHKAGRVCSAQAGRTRACLACSVALAAGPRRAHCTRQRCQQKRRAALARLTHPVSQRTACRCTCKGCGRSRPSGCRTALRCTAAGGRGRLLGRCLAAGQRELDSGRRQRRAGPALP